MNKEPAEKCQPNVLDIFKVMIPFMGSAAEICFCENSGSSPEMALCRTMEGKAKLVAVLAREPLKRTLDSACKVTAMNGAGMVCLCGQQHPLNRDDYLRCLRDDSIRAMGQIPPSGAKTETAPANR